MSLRIIPENTGLKYNNAFAFASEGSQSVYYVTVFVCVM